MFDAEAIKELAKGQAIGAASDAVAVADLSLSLLALPNDFTAHDIERFATNRRRPRGTMTARSIDHFVGYIDQRHQIGATVFVDPADLSATAVLDMGTRDAPGHCDDTASLAMVPTAAYATARSIWHGAQMPQRKAAEWVEDWSDYLTCFDDDGAEIANKHAASALRAITIDAMKRLESTEQSLAQERSAFERVAATSSQKIPARILLRCAAYLDLMPREFSMRLAIQPQDKGGPTISLRIQREEWHAQEMANELIDTLRRNIEAHIPVFAGRYVVRP